MSTPVALLLTDRDGAYVGVKFANRDVARAFEDHHGLTSEGCIDLVTQGQAVLRGVLA